MFCQCYWLFYSFALIIQTQLRSRNVRPWYAASPVSVNLAIHNAKSNSCYSVIIIQVSG